MWLAKVELSDVNQSQNGIWSQKLLCWFQVLCYLIVGYDKAVSHG